MATQDIRENAQLKLINELGEEKFSWKSILKAVELYALMQK